MRLIQNTTLQGWNIPFKTPTGLYEVYLRPKSKIAIPDNYQSSVLETLIRRRMIRVLKIDR